MFKLLKIFFLLTIGVYLGFQLSMMAMRGQCSGQNGVWTDGVCLVSEVSK